MSGTIPLLFCRYELSIDDEALAPSEQLDALSGLRGRLVAYRKPEATEDDKDTYLMMPKLKQIEGETVLTWHVAVDIRTREIARSDRRNDRIVSEAVATEECKHTKFIALPRLGVMAVHDRMTFDSIPGRAAASRFKAIFGSIRNGKARIEFAGTNADVQRALDTWELSQFAFTVRPFNPTIRKPGEQLHEMMLEDGIGALRGVAIPVEGKRMQDSHRGLIAEAKGLSDHGYGQISAKGTTPSGIRATLAKPKFDQDKEKNKERQAAGRSLKVYIDEGASIEEEEEAAVRALLEFYGRT